ncbi:MAG: DUF6531 domain-containing protein [Candidatus Polarisedimenticolia bacterium]
MLNRMVVVRLHPRFVCKFLTALISTCLIVSSLYGQTITITSINGQTVPPADEVFIPQDQEAFTIEWEASQSATSISLIVDGANVPCGGGCGGGLGGELSASIPGGGCRHTVQLRALFGATTFRNSQGLGFWTTPYKECTGCTDCNAGKGAVGGPIDVATGKMYYEMVDFTIGGPLPIQFTRRYDSQSTFNGPLGFGWHHNYMMRMESAGATRQVFVDGQGRRIHFERLQPASTWDENRLEDLVLTQSGSTFRVTDKHLTRYDFDTSGRLSSITDRNGNQLLFAYPSGNLDTITDSFGRVLSLSYSGGHLQSISGGGRTVSYTYSGDDLTFVHYADNSSLTYEYDPLEMPHNLTRILDQLGNVVEAHDYNGTDQVMHFERHGGVGALTIAYNSPTQTTVTNSRGFQTIYTHDEFSGLIKTSSGPSCGLCGPGEASVGLLYWENDQVLNVKERTDGRGFKTEFTYDSKGNVTEKKEAVGIAGVERTWDFLYHPTFNFQTSSSIASVGTCSNPNRVETTAYEGDGDPNSRTVVGCNGSIPFSYTTSFEHDPNGRLTKVVGPRLDLTDDTSYAYYDSASPEPINKRGRLKSITNALGHQVLYNDYDFFGNVLSITDDENQVTTTFVYDGRDRLTERRIEGMMDADDIATQNIYDLAGRMDQVRLPNCVAAGPSCIFSFDYGYDGANRLTEVKDALGNKTAYAYDTESNRTREETINPAMMVRRFTNFAYDSLNRLEYVYFTDPPIPPPPDPNAIFWKFTYDGNGNRTVERDPEGHVVTNTYDELNRVKVITQPIGVTEYQYDVQDNLKKVKDPRLLETDYTNSDMGWRLQVTSPDTGVTINVYDPAGNVTSTTNEDDTVITKGYDALNRLGTVSYPTPGLNITYTYDSPAVSFGVGRRTGMTDPSGTSVFNYDRRGIRVREDKTISGVTFTTQYGYDKNSNRTDILYPTSDPNSRQEHAVFAFDVADRIASVTATVNGSTDSVASGLTYEPFGPVTSIPFSNGRTDTRVYDSRYRLGDWSVSGVLAYAHGYNNDDNLTSRVDGVSNRFFGYDAIHRLTNAIGPWGPGIGCAGSTYAYDLNGNRTCKAEGSTTTYVYASISNHLNTAMGGESAAYLHDENGNLDHDGTHSYLFDDSDRLAQVDAGATASYTYDGDGRRAIKNAGGATTYYFYDPDGRLLTETVNAEGAGKDYLYLGEAPLARVDWTAEEFLLGDTLLVTGAGSNVHLDWTAFPFPPASHKYVVRRKQIVDYADKTFNGNIAIATPQDPTRVHDDPVLADANPYFYLVLRRVLNDSLYFYHTDHLGTPLAMTAHTGGTLVWRAEHLPFGGVQSLPVSTVTNNLRFLGQYFDQETGLHQNWFRDYDSSLGRYREPDPVGLRAGSTEGIVGLYSYANLSPVVLSDPMGLSVKTKNCTLDQDRRLQVAAAQAEAASQTCLSCPDDRPGFRQKIRDLTVYCVGTEITESGTACGRAGQRDKSGRLRYWVRSIAVTPEGFSGSANCPCLKSVVLHETLHLLKYGHQPPKNAYDEQRRCFPSCHPEFVDRVTVTP